MVAINTLLCLLGFTVLGGLASPIGIFPRPTTIDVFVERFQRRSSNPDAAVAFGDGPVRRGAGTRSSSSTTSSAWHYQPTASLSTPSSSAVSPAATGSSSSSSSSSGVSLNGVSVPSFDSSKPFALSYSPYTSSGGCKAVSDIETDLQTIYGQGFQCIRLYGTDCNQIQNVLTAMSSTGCSFKLFLGIYDLSSASSETSALISAMNSDWTDVITISVGNEPVNQGLATPATVISTTASVRSQLRAYNPRFQGANCSAGYTGPVVAVDTFIAIYNNPSLCQASDYVAANAHAYFDGTVAASGAGAWVAQQASKLASVCGGKGVLITETGWPSAGNANGAAIPSKANQATAKAGILSSMGNKCVLFSAFDDAWKAPGEYDVEQHWVRSLILVKLISGTSLLNASYFILIRFLVVKLSYVYI